LEESHSGVLFWKYGILDLLIEKTYNELMPRVKFLKNNQRKFIVSVKENLNIDWPVLSEILGISNRTMSDWRREKFLINEAAFKKCLSLVKGKIKVPNYKLLPDFWSTPKAAKRGGLATAKKYGGPGTPEGRRKGGLISQERRKLYPELYTNCNSRRIISEPKESADLAEVIGIMLGDGSISRNCTQAVISLHKKDDRNYILLVCDLIKKLFSVDPVIYRYQKGSHKNVADITIHSTSLVSFLKYKGMKSGHKVKQQVDVPRWIKINKDFSKYCLRGLIDTDGSVYSHKHKTNGCDCFNIGLNFSNRSTPLLEFVYKTLKNLKFHPKIFTKGVNLYRESEVCRYAEEVKFSNIYHKNRLSNFLKQKHNWKGV